jgi:hypothetical protein
MESSDSRHEEGSRQFHRLFGISEDELISRGIDPGDYARKNVRKALRDATKWNGILPKSNQFGILWTRWGLRGFIAFFIGIGFLAVSKFQALHWLGIVGAFSMLMVAVGTAAQFQPDKATRKTARKNPSPGTTRTCANSAAHTDGESVWVSRRLCSLEVRMEHGKSESRTEEVSV